MARRAGEGRREIGITGRVKRRKMLTKEDLKVGRIYRGKRFRQFFGGNNDRRIVWMSDTKVQYDSDTVKMGRRFPIVDIEVFLRWAKEKI